MENNKIKIIKEHILKEAEAVVEEYVNKGENKKNLESINMELKRKIKKLKFLLLCFFIILIIVLIFK